MAASDGQALSFNDGETENRAENKKKILRLGLILFTVAAITGIILGIVYQITLEPIRETQERLRGAALSGALPEAKSFSLVEIVPDADPMIVDVQEALDGDQLVGYCLTLTSKGYGGPLEIVVGITETGKLRAIRILSHSETPGLGAKAPLPVFSGQYENREAEKLILVKTAPERDNEVQAISGATITSTAVTDGVNAALDYWRNHLKTTLREGTEDEEEEEGTEDEPF
ncbi:MAG: RnfABCDGE type electron transport complex subunit G [Synergistaceae bacterium]|jgi:electron transport complex protein RnfG|nr:RnfABCDGE type electron transport complex subunit G [Synergistaceae bacterium]